MKNQAEPSKNHAAAKPEQEVIEDSKISSGQLKGTRVGAQQDKERPKNIRSGAESGAILTFSNHSDRLEAHVTVDTQYSMVPVRNPSALRDSLKPSVD